MMASPLFLLPIFHVMPGAFEQGLKRIQYSSGNNTTGRLRRLEPCHRHWSQDTILPEIRFAQSRFYCPLGEVDFVSEHRELMKSGVRMRGERPSP